MTATTIQRTGGLEPGRNALQPCHCDDCTKIRTDEEARAETDGWEVWINGWMICPACGAQLFPHFKAKHMRWHLSEGTISARRAAEWTTELENANS